ncbi:solute carrier family 25 member 36-like [Paramuricea clavata]|uniref:Solute carrier family 25 member 36-like n=1 Tax=Paramuricea clavata TaxID=317549 RepID=A0A7D9ICB5_PARCT|nr:solute carrier family 25 member 36-like [Paramuricea clavata]
MALEHRTRDVSKSLDLIAGGLAGATATAVTYPLEVLKTRLQSSTFNVGRVHSRLPLFALGQNINLSIASPVTSVRHATLFSYARQMIQNEGYVLFSRGFAANVMAVSMSKAIYFPVYSCCKRFLGQNRGQSEHVIIHSSSAAIAGFVSCTVTNPIWFLKTRLQLDCEVSKHNWLKMPVAIEIYKKEGIRAFYSGLAASYLGIVETMLHFAIYEYLRGLIRQRDTSRSSSSGARLYLTDCMLAAATSKTIATVIAYPHEVFRTRTRERENIGKSFITLFKNILRNEGWKAFYRGLGTHLVRQVPNSAILFLTYETIIYFGTQ